MKKQSTHAAAAKMIRQELKKHGIPAKVRSSSFSMGNDVRIELENQPPGVVKRVEQFANQFQYGHFDGMQDLYEYSNSRDDIPQVKFVFVNPEYTDDYKQAAYDWLRGFMAGYTDLPERYEDARDMYADNNDQVSQAVWRVLRGVYWNGRDGGFWKARLPTVRSEAPERVSSAESAAKAAYAEDVRRQPFYHDGSARKLWEQLGAAEQSTWIKNPTPRPHNVVQLRA